MTELFKKVEKAGHSTPNIDVIKTANKINASRKEKIECFIDIDTGDAKEITTDLRDISKLIKENNLPAKEKMNVCQTKTILKNRDYHLSLAPADNFSENRSHLTLEENEKFGYISLKVMSLGMFPSYYLTDAFSSTLSEQEDGKLKIEVTDCKHKEYTAIILCDPSLDYHVISTKSYKEGFLAKEMAFTDYRTINKIPFPFHYTEKSFDKDGNVLTEKIYPIENLEFNQKFAPDTFKVTIPDGTQFTDFAVSNVVYNLDEGGFWSMDELLAVVTKNAERFQNPTENKCSQQNP